MTVAAVKVSWVLSIVGTLLAAGVIGLFAQHLSLSQWRGEVTEFLRVHGAENQNVRTALTVLGDHGTELQQLRGQVENVRGEVSATRKELLEAVREAATDRFRGADWTREKEVIELRFRAIESEMARFKDMLTTITSSLQRIEKKLGAK